MARSLQAITPGVGPDKQGLAIPPGMKAVDIRSDQLINGYPTGQSPQSGDQVSLTISFQFADAVATGDSQLPATQRVGEARQMSVTYPALVVSIGPPPSDGHDGSTHQPSPTPPAGGTAVITFALGERDAVTLNWAVNSKLPIWMTLRGTDS